MSRRIYYRPEEDITPLERILMIENNDSEVSV